MELLFPPWTVILNKHSTKQCQNYQMPTLLQFLRYILLSQGHSSSTSHLASLWVRLCEEWDFSCQLPAFLCGMKKQPATRRLEDPALNWVLCYVS